MEQSVLNPLRSQEVGNEIKQNYPYNHYLRLLVTTQTGTQLMVCVNRYSTKDVNFILIYKSQKELQQQIAESYQTTQPGSQNTEGDDLRICQFKVNNIRFNGFELCINDKANLSHFLDDMSKITCDILPNRHRFDVKNEEVNKHKLSKQASEKNKHRKQDIHPIQASPSKRPKHPKQVVEEKEILMEDEDQVISETRKQVKPNPEPKQFQIKLSTSQQVTQPDIPNKKSEKPQLIKAKKVNTTKYSQEIQSPQNSSLELGLEKAFHKKPDAIISPIKQRINENQKFKEVIPQHAAVKTVKNIVQPTQKPTLKVTEQVRILDEISLDSIDEETVAKKPDVIKQVVKKDQKPTQFDYSRNLFDNVQHK